MLFYYYVTIYIYVYIKLTIRPPLRRVDLSILCNAFTHPIRSFKKSLHFGEGSQCAPDETRQCRVSLPAQIYNLSYYTGPHRRLVLDW